MSFKVGSQDGERGRERGGSIKEREDSHHEDRGRDGRGEGRGVDDDGAEPMDQDDEEEEEGDLMEDGDDMDAMAAMMGFGGFGTTKGKKIAGNNVGGVRKEKKTEYRQYMNRAGGFNRPLSPPR